MAETRDGVRHAPALRVGDVERDACVVALIDHHLQGRLSAEELDHRQQLAQAAVHADDLALLLADLPPSGARSTSVARPPSGAARRAATAVLGALPVVAVATFAQEHWQYSAEGPFLGALAGGAVGVATHAVVVRLRR